MRSSIVIDLGSANRERLERIWKDLNTPQKHVWRAEIVLLSADVGGTSEIMRRTGTSKTCVWWWQERLMQEGGKACCATSPLSRIPAPTPEVVAWVATLTHEEPPGETSHWTASVMAREGGSAHLVGKRRELSGRRSGVKRSTWWLMDCCCPYFSNSSMARKLELAQPRGTSGRTTIDHAFYTFRPS